MTHIIACRKLQVFADINKLYTSSAKTIGQFDRAARHYVRGIGHFQKVKVYLERKQTPSSAT